jgi:glycosyltransferase involved in cell wall biosynthesis
MYQRHTYLDEQQALDASHSQLTSTNWAPRLRWGIHMTGGDGRAIWSDAWIAGRIYLDNLISAVHYLPENEQPEIVLIQEPSDVPAPSLESKCSTLEVRSAGRTRQLRRLPKLSFLANSTYHSDIAPQLYGNLDFIFPAISEFQIAAFPNTAAWIPDLQHVHLPQFFSRSERTNRDRSYRRLAGCAPIVVLSSHDARMDFERLFPDQAHKVRVLSFVTVPGPAWFAGDPSETAIRYGLPDLYVMVPNQFWTHKNHLCVFKALDEVRRSGKDIRVVCTGATHDYRNPHHFERMKAFLRDNDLESCVHILGLIPRLDQIQLLRRAALVIQPSLFEGWSTVVEDVRALGKRLVVSDLGVHREQNVEDAVYFDPHDSSMLADILLHGLPDLVPGPDIEQEQRNANAHRLRIISYARQFLHVTYEVASLRKGGRHE